MELPKWSKNGFLVSFVWIGIVWLCFVGYHVAEYIFLGAIYGMYKVIEGMATGMISINFDSWLMKFLFACAALALVALMHGLFNHLKKRGSAE